MNDVVLENTCDIKCKQVVLLRLFCSVCLYFFHLIDYQNMAAEKILQFVLKSLSSAVA